MNKILKLTSVSILAIMTANGANAAGYTCEELIEYTSCEEGYYLGDSVPECPAGYTFRQGICDDTYDNSQVYFNITNDRCMSYNSSATYYEYGCVQYDADRGDFRFQQSTGTITTTCLDCPTGSYCTGGKNAATLCPAGSYCDGTKLAAVSGVCDKGSYSSAGSTACTTCPARVITDSDGNYVSVPATTELTGAGSITACEIDKSVSFTDSKGTYKFTENCAFEKPTTYDEACELNLNLCYAQYDESDWSTYCDPACGCSDDYQNETFVFDEETGDAFCWLSSSFDVSIADSQIWIDGADYAASKSNCTSAGGTWSSSMHRCLCPDGLKWGLEDTAEGIAGLCM